ncbi:MAG: hypothetical protein NTZ78_11590 [Candidatus Aureabacteria bacterium]|nr:hypothetical protein [Candidatus Auribacterota bacterium]
MARDTTRLFRGREERSGTNVGATRRSQHYSNGDTVFPCCGRENMLLFGGADYPYIAIPATSQRQVIGAAG